MGENYTYMLTFVDQHFYLLMLLTAVIVALVTSIWRRKKYDYKLVTGLVVTALCAFYGLVGVRLLFILETPGSGFGLFGGYSFFGAIYFVPIAIFVTSLIMDKPFTEMLDFITPYIPMTLAFMRFGCTYNGCCGANPIMTPAGEVVVPIQMTEAVFDLGIVAFTVLMEMRKQKQGIAFPRFAVMYGVLRLVTENYRDTPKDTYGMSHGQWFAIFSIVLGSIAVLILTLKDNHPVVARKCLRK